MQCSACVLCVPIMQSTKYRWKVKHLSLDSLFIQQNDLWKKKYAMDQSKTLNWSWNSLLNMDDCFLNSPFSSQLSYGQVYLEGEFLVGCSFRSSLHIDDLIHWEVNPPVWNGSLTCKDCYMGHKYDTFFRTSKMLMGLPVPEHSRLGVRKSSRMTSA